MFSLNIIIMNKNIVIQILIFNFVIKISLFTIFRIIYSVKNVWIILFVKEDIYHFIQNLQ